jgi:acetyltransferase-like isoleucine patch superfamily enzyme
MAIASPSILEKLIGRTVNPEVWFPNLVAPNAFFFDENNVKMGRGNLVTFGCRFSCKTSLGNFNILNGQVSLGHDVSMGDYNVLMPETRISGESTIGSGNFFGARSLVLQGIKIGNNTRIGSGSVVMRKTKDGMSYFGNPAKIIGGE